MPAWDSPLVVVPLAVAVVLAMARLARLRPPLRPLVGPLAISAASLTLFQLLGRELPARHWALLAVYVPLLALLVRAVVVGFRLLFLSRQGVEAPALLESVVVVVLYAVGGGLIVRHLFGIELTPFLATSAVVGAVVGLALQDTLGNLFAGIALHSEAPFRVGDWVRVGDRDGQVEQVSWRAMRLRTWDGDTLTVPNNEVARHTLLNYSLPREPHTRLLFVGVSYQTPPNKVISVLRSLLSQVEGLPAQPEPRVRMLAYGESSITYEVRYPFAGYEDYRRVEGEILRLIWYHFRRHGIEIPFPIRNVYLHQPPTGTEAGEVGTRRIERALRQIDLFRPLSDEELRSVAARCRRLHYAARERIIEEGASGDSFFVIDRGEVDVSKVLGGRPRTLARLMEGQFFGEMALLTGEQRTASVVAATDVELITIDRSGFRAVLVHNPAIAEDISTILSERRDALSQAEGDVTARLTTEGSRQHLRESILSRMRAFFGI